MYNAVVMATGFFPIARTLGTALAAWFLLGACAQGIDQTTQPSPHPTLNVATTPATASHADVVIGIEQSQQTLPVKVGQILNLPDGFGLDWHISFNPAILQALTPEEMMKHPGPVGWFFKVVSPGTTTILLTSIPAPCPAGTPCQPNVVRLEFTIQATP